VVPTVVCSKFSEGPGGRLIESSKAHSISISFVNTLEKQGALFMDRMLRKINKFQGVLLPRFVDRVYIEHSASKNDGCSMLSNGLIL